MVVVNTKVVLGGNEISYQKTWGKQERRRNSFFS
jgi:hypothetical protein